MHSSQLRCPKCNATMRTTGASEGWVEVECRCGALYYWPASKLPGGQVEYSEILEQTNSLESAWEKSFGTPLIDQKMKAPARLCAGLISGHR